MGRRKIVTRTRKTDGAAGCLPTSGRIGRIARQAERLTGRAAAEKALKGAWEFDALRPGAKADWLRQAMERMEREMGAQLAREVMAACGRKCCHGASKLAEKLGSVCRSLHDLVTIDPRIANAATQRRSGSSVC